MNDRFLFRGKRLDNGEWVIGHYREYPIYASCGKCIEKINYFIDNGQNSEFIDPSTLGQCTGLECYKDPLYERGEEGKQLLFEADIISFSIFDHNDHDTQHIGVIYWDCGAYWIDCTDSEGDEGIYNLFTTMMGDDCVEVIGNAHDNPELLGGEK